MKVTAIIPDEIINDVQEYTEGKNITDSLIKALSDWLYIKRIQKLNREVRKEPLQFLDGFSIAELLYGSRNDKERSKIISYWKVLPRINFSEGSIIESAEFANKSNFHNLGIGLIDSILINATIINKCLLWSLDKKILNNLDDKLLYKSHKI